MRALRTILVWTIAVGAAAAWWRIGGARSTATTGREAIGVFTGSLAFVPDSITSMRLVRRGHEPLVFSREGREWVQTAPFRAELDGYSAMQLVGLASELSALREADDARASEPSKEPLATLTLEGAGGVSRRIDFLRRGVAGRALISVADRTYVTDAELFSRAVEMDPKEWRSRAIFPESLGRIERIRRISKEGTIELVREGELWRMTSPIKARADRARIDELIGAIARSKSAGFVLDAPPDLGPFGLDQPVRTLAVDYAGETSPMTRRLLIGAPLGVGSDDCYAMIEGVPSVLRLAGSTRDALLPPDALLVDPTATGVRAADVKRIEIRTKDASLELVRSLDHWTVAPITNGEVGMALAAQAATVDGLLSTLCSLRAPELSFSGFPKDLEVATILLFAFDGKPLDIVRVARDPKSNRWGFDNGEGALRVHPATTEVPLGIAAFSGSG